MAAFPTFAGLAIDVKRSGPFYDEIIATSSSGKETRATFQVSPRYRWKLSLERLSQDQGGDEVATLVNFIAARKGRYDSFSFTCPIDGSTYTVRFDTPEIELERIANRIFRNASLTLVSLL